MTCHRSTSRVRRWLVRLVVLGLALLAAVAFPVPFASAHAVFVSADPPPGAALRTPPTSVRMVFSEPLNPALSGIAVYASSGRRVPPRDSGVDPDDSRAYDVALPPLRPDRYAVVWHTVSEVDGHSRRGSYTFTVDRPDGSAPAVHHVAPPVARGGPQVPTAGQAAATWFGLTGLFLLTGVVLLALLGTGTGVLAAGVRRWSWRLLVAGAAGLVVGTVGEAIADWAPTGWTATGLGSILTSSAGRWWEIRLVAAAAVLAAWAWPRRLGIAARVVGVGVVAWSFAATAHGAASARPTLGVGYEFVHILAASVWLGGAVALAFAWAVSRRAGVGDRRVLVRRFSIVAGIAVPVVLISGLGNAVLELGNIDEFVSSSYGVSLLAKLVVALVLTGIAAANAFVLRPAADAGQPRGRLLGRTIAVEAAIGLAVLVPTAVLAVLAPSRPGDEARAEASRLQARSDPAHAFTGSTAIGGRDAEITLTPGTVGVNAVRVEVDGRYRPASLQLALTGPAAAHTADLRRTGHDHDDGTHTIYQGTAQFDRSGTWRVVLRSGSGGAPGAPVVMPVTKPVEPATSGTDHLSSWLGLIALAGVGIALAAAARAVPSRRRTGVLALGASGVVVAAAWAAALAVNTWGPTAPPADRSAGWGEVRSVSPAHLAEARVWRIPTPGAGLMMPAIGPDGSVWLAEMNTNRLARVDPRANTVREFRFPGGYRESMGVAVGSDGTVWVAQEHAMALGRFDPRSGSYREFRIPGGTSAPVGIAIGPRGTVWFTEMSGNKIGAFDPRTKAFRSYPVPTSNALPYWLALAPDGTAWFTEFGAGRVGALDPRSGRVTEYDLPGRPNAAGIAVDRDGTVWCVGIDGSLFRVTSAGGVRRIALPAPGDYGVAAGPDGTVWVGRDGGRALYALRPGTDRFRTYRLPPASAPWWPIVDGRGHVWVALAAAEAGVAEVDGTS